MNNEPKETGRLEGDAARRQARIILLEKRNQQLEEALTKLRKVSDTAFAMMIGVQNPAANDEMLANTSAALLVALSEAGYKVRRKR